MESKKYILVEYYNDKDDDESLTYELFEDIEKAFNFAKEVKVNRIDLVIANNLYYEANKVLNYEDYSNTIEKGIISNVY